MGTWRHPFEAAPIAVIPHGVPARLDVALDAGDLALIRTLRPESPAMWVATGGSALCSIAVYCAVWDLPIALGLVLGMWVHELGHVAVLQRLGIERGPIVFVPLVGAVQRLCAQPARAVDSAMLALAGPICGLLFASACKLGYAISGFGVLRFLGTAHALLAIIDMLPFGTLDGKRVLNALRELGRDGRAIALVWFGAAACALALL